MTNIGEVLKTARRDAGLTPFEVAGTTKIRLATLVRFERDEFSGAGDVYERSHLGKAAEAVGLDPGPLLAAYDARTGRSAGGRRSAIVARELQRRPRPPRNWSLILAVGLGLTAIYALALVVAGVLS